MHINNNNNHNNKRIKPVQFKLKNRAQKTLVVLLG